MKRRFVVAADKLSTEQEKEFRRFLTQFGGFWHWIDNFWLLAVGGEEDISVAQIRDKVHAINPASRIIVLEVGNDVDWAGRGKKNSAGKNQHDWLKTTWADQDD
jgi:hypothetical protein